MTDWGMNEVAQRAGHKPHDPDSEWQPARLIDVHDKASPELGSYLSDEQIREEYRRLVFVRPFDLKRHGWTLRDLRLECDCPDGTQFYEVKGDDLSLVCEHEILTD
jgi:hypothetical protein